MEHHIYVRMPLAQFMPLVGSAHAHSIKVAVMGASDEKNAYSEPVEIQFQRSLVKSAVAP